MIVEEFVSGFSLGFLTACVVILIIAFILGAA